MSNNERPSSGRGPSHKPKRKTDATSKKRSSQDGQPHYRPNTMATGSLNAGTFAKARSYVDAVAFGTPGRSPVAVRLFQEAVESFQLQGREPRNFLLILSQGIEASNFEAFSLPFRRMKLLLDHAQLVNEERAYWKLRFHRSTQKLDAGSDGLSVELRKLEKRPASRHRR